MEFSKLKNTIEQDDTKPAATPGEQETIDRDMPDENETDDVAVADVKNCRAGQHYSHKRRDHRKNSY